ncbi:hypothetical protein GOBAR_DD36249 [Gossypium barbadense]|nr:hypothetical protein GOBAR_DD36249 [Gossypium barbadense]
MADVEGNFQGQSLEDVEEKEAVKLKALVSRTGESLENCLVGTFLTSSVINFSSIRATLANVDADRIKAGGPWNFNSHLLILQKLHDEDNPKTVPLNTVDFWVLIQDVPHGFSSKSVARQMGNFIGQFIDYDCKAINLGYIRVRVDVEKSLKPPFRRAAAPSSRWLREEGVVHQAYSGLAFTLANSEGNNNGNGDEYQNEISAGLAQRASQKY